MKKLLLCFLGILFYYPAIFADSGINIVSITPKTNDTKVINQQYEYNVLFTSNENPFGRKTQWTITNGYFRRDYSDDTTKPTKIDLNLEEKSVIVVFTKPGIATIDYSYTTGSGGTYQGHLDEFVTDPNANTGGGSTGGGGTSGGNNNSNTFNNLSDIWKYVDAQILANKIPYNMANDGAVKDTIYEDETLNLSVKNITHSIIWRKSDNLDFVNPNDSTNTNVSFKVKNKLKYDSEDAYVKYVIYGGSDDYSLRRYAYKSFKLLAAPDFKITPDKDPIAKIGNFTCTLTGFPSANSVAEEIIWRENIPKLKIIEGQGTTSATFGTVNVGLTTVNADIKYNGRVFNAQTTVWGGSPSTVSNIDGLTSNDYVSTNQNLTLTADARGATEYIWNVVTGGTLLTSGNSATVSVMTGYTTTYMPITVTVQSKNPYGTSSIYSVTAAVKNPNYNGIGVKSIAIGNTEDNTIEIAYSVKVFQLLSGNIVYKRASNTSFDINDTSLSPGIYIIEKTFANGTTVKEKVFKK